MKTKSEVLRYLGRNGQSVPDDLDILVDDCIALMRSSSSFRQVHSTFPISPAVDGIALTGTELFLRGKDIARALSGCRQTVLLAATLGAGTDALINKWKHADPLRSLVLDACATQLIEEHCDNFERQIWTEAAASGLKGTRRFSPGYGDLSLDIQPLILKTLDAGKKIGLTCTEHLILLPRKSVTAFIGLGEKNTIHTSGCEKCNLLDKCNFRKDNNNDGCQRMDKE